MSDDATPRIGPRTRVALLAVILGGIWLVMWRTGALEQVTVDWVRAKVETAGALGWLLYVGAFCGGVMLHIPGVVFALTGVLVFGPVLGGLLAYSTGLLAISLNFLFIRTVGGQPLNDIENKLVRRALDHIDDHPVRSVAIGRLLLSMSPPVNLALALSSISFRQHLAGSALGLIVPMLVVALFTDAVVRWVAG
ncbi:MAG: VTT domain-containing protein [Alphaproteobacteria bacterium]|nr:VTT domain-containing protein [Alphaproteobacteria bacterium]